eukprot:gene4716-5053_t
MLTRHTTKTAVASPFGGSDSSSDDEQKDDLAQGSDDEEDAVDNESDEMVPDQLRAGYTGNIALTLLKTPQKNSDVKARLF